MANPPQDVDSPLKAVTASSRLLQPNGAPRYDRAAVQVNQLGAEETCNDYTTQQADGPAEESVTTRAIVIMLSMWMCSFFAALDSTIMATLSSPISATFQSSKSLQWIASAYLVANATFQPMSGKLSDKFGRRAGATLAACLFALGTLICGLAQNVPTMIVGRILAGSGGGCLNTISTFIASDLVPLRKRGLWQGFANIVYGSGMGLGGIIGGILNDTFGWRWAFLVQVPFIISAGTIAWWTIDIPIKESNRDRLERIDFLGALTLSTTLVALLLGINCGGAWVSWTHPLLITTVGIAISALCLFIYVESHLAGEPIIPVRLFLHRTVAGACLTNWFNAMAVYALLYYIPIYHQIVVRSSTVSSGVYLLPQSLGTACGSLTAGLLMRSNGRYWWLSLAAKCLYFGSSVAITLLLRDDTSKDWLLLLFLTVSGIAHGVVLTTMLTALLSAVDHDHQAVVTSASYAFRSTGASIGITLASAIFQHSLTNELEGRFHCFPQARTLLDRIRDNIGNVSLIPPKWRCGVQKAYISSLEGVWLTVTILNLLGVIACLTTREHKLERRAGRE